MPPIRCDLSDGVTRPALTLVYSSLMDAARHWDSEGDRMLMPRAAPLSGGKDNHHPSSDLFFYLKVATLILPS